MRRQFYSATPRGTTAPVIVTPVGTGGPVKRDQAAFLMRNLRRCVGRWDTMRRRPVVRDCSKRGVGLAVAPRMEGRERRTAARKRFRALLAS